MASNIRMLGCTQINLKGFLNVRMYSEIYLVGGCLRRSHECEYPIIFDLINHKEDTIIILL